MTALHQPIIGEISYQQQAKKTMLFLPCLVHRPTSISCLILDEKGRQIAERKITQKASQPSLVFQLPRLKAGLYNCWIEIDGKMLIQQLAITSEKKRGLIAKLFNQSNTKY